MSEPYTFSAKPLRASDNAKATTVSKRPSSHRKDISYRVTTHIYNNFRPGAHREMIVNLMKCIREQYTVFGWAVIYDMVCSRVGVKPDYTPKQWEKAYSIFKEQIPTTKPGWKYILDEIKKYAETHY